MGGDEAQANPTLTLAQTFFSAATMQDPTNARHLPVLDDNFKELLLKRFGKALPGTMNFPNLFPTES